MATLTVTDTSGAKTFTTRTQRDGSFVSAVSLDTAANTYRAAISFTPFATSAVVLFRFAGSSAVIARVKRVQVGGVSTASGSFLAQLQRVTSAGTGGTAVNATVAKHSLRSPNASCSLTGYSTAAQSAGTSATGQGPLWNGRVGTSIVAAPSTSGFWNPQVIFPENGVAVGASIEVNQALTSGDALEFGQPSAANLPAGTVLDVVVEWEEYVVGAE